MEFRHFQTYRLPRGKRWDPPYTQLLPLVWPPEQRRHRVLLPSLARRGRVWVLAQVDPPPSRSSLRRGVRLPSVRRPRPAVVMASQTAPPGNSRPRSGRLSTSRRGKFLSFVPDQIVVTPGSWVPEIRHRTRLVMFSRRGRFLSFVPDQVIVPLVWVPEIRHRTRLVLFVRRGRFIDTSWLQIAAQPPPPWVPEPRRRARNLPLARRGHLFEAPRGQATIPDREQPRRAQAFRIIRGRTALPPWSQVIVIPIWPPATIAQKRLRWARVRRGQTFWTVPAQHRTPDRIPKRLRFGVIRKRGRGWGPNLVGALFGPVPPWLEGGSASTGREGASYVSAPDGSSLGLGSEGSSSAGDFEGTSSER